MTDAEQMTDSEAVDPQGSSTSDPGEGMTEMAAGAEGPIATEVAAGDQMAGSDSEAGHAAAAQDASETDRASIHQGVVREIGGREVHMVQSAAGAIEADDVSLVQSVVALVRAEEVSVSMGGAGLIAGDRIRVAQGGAQAILARESVSVEQGGAGYTCLAEVRTVELILEGKPRTPFLGFGDRVRIEMLDEASRSIFGAIDQEVVRYTK